MGIKNSNQSQAQDKDTGKKPAKGKKAAEVTNEPAQPAQQPETQLLGFRGVYVFDVQQTGGEELTQSRKPVDVAETLEKLTAFAQDQKMSIEYARWIAPNKGTSYRGTIRLLPNMEPAEAFPVLLREVANQMLYAIQRRTFVTRALHQQETKAAAFVVCEALELKSKTAFSDCQLYYGDSRLLAESLQVVHRTAAQILGAISPEDGAPAQFAPGGAIMSSPVPFLPPVLEIINAIVTSKTIPELNEAELSEVTHYLFKHADKALRLAIAEIAYRNPKQPHALDLFLSCAMPLAQKWAVRKAHRLFMHPSDWQIDCFYNGAVSAMLKTFQNPFPLRDEPDAFRRFLPYRFACGAIEAYFTRQENYRTQTVENLELATRPDLHSNPIEQELITRDLLEKISEYPLLQRSLSKTLECIRELGPDVVLKERHWAEERNPERSKKGFAGRPMLNAETIAQARGVTTAFVHCQISTARRILQKAFNGDGRLFATH